MKRRIICESDNFETKEKRDKKVSKIIADCQKKDKENHTVKFKIEN